MIGEISAAIVAVVLIASVHPSRPRFRASGRVLTPEQRLANYYQRLGVELEAEKVDGEWIPTVAYLKRRQQGEAVKPQILARFKTHARIASNVTPIQEPSHVPVIRRGRHWERKPTLTLTRRKS